MKLYSVFVAMAFFTVLSPGPGVVMTISNALRHSKLATLAGILGVASGALIVASISASSLGILLASSALAFSITKYIGAAYLLYLSWRLWRAPGFKFETQAKAEGSAMKRFVEGATLQLSNPKAIFFFLSIFPQFIDVQQQYLPQFLKLVMTYAGLVILIHCGYAAFAKSAKPWLSSLKGAAIMNKSAALCFAGFGLALANAKR